MIDPPAIYNELGQILVCEPTRPHMRKLHVAHRAIHILPPRPTLRAHPHRHRVCHAHVRCHWEDVLGGPAGAWPSGDAYPELDSGSDLGSYGDFGTGQFGGSSAGFDSFGGGFGTGLFISHTHAHRLLQLVATTPLDRQIVDQGPPDTVPPIELAPPPIQAIPEPATWLLIAIGLAGMIVMKLHNRRRVSLLTFR